jgi:hypothetical protein
MTWPMRCWHSGPRCKSPGSAAYPGRLRLTAHRWMHETVLKLLLLMGYSCSRCTDSVSRALPPNLFRGSSCASVFLPGQMISYQCERTGQCFLVLRTFQSRGSRICNRLVLVMFSSNYYSFLKKSNAKSPIAISKAQTWVAPHSSI